MKSAVQPDFRDAGSLDESSPTPLYLQLQHLIQQAVRSGKLRADEALPSERDLSRQLGISRVTVRKAIAGLVEKGMLLACGAGLTAFTTLAFLGAFVP